MELLGTSPRITLGRQPPFEDRILSALLVQSEGLARGGAPFQGLMQSLTGGGLVGLGALNEAPYLNPPGAIPLHLDLFAVSWERASARMVEAHRLQTNSTPTHYAEKVPESLFGLLKGRFRVARILYPIRDPRDQWISAEAMGQREGHGNLRPPGGDGESRIPGFVQALPVIRRRLSLLAAGPSAAVFPVSYEKLVGNVQATASEIGAWLGLPLHPERLNLQSAFALGHRTAPSGGATTERWRQEMSAAEQAWFRDHVGDLLTAVGLAVE
jgi:hypothetical protein